MTVLHHSQYFCFTALTVGVGATGSVEIGGAFDTSGNVIAYNGHCLGGDLSDEFASIDGSIVVGFWNELGSIPGHSHTIGTSFGAEEGKDFSFLFFNLKNIYYNTQGRHSNQCHRAMARVDFLPRNIVYKACWSSTIEASEVALVVFTADWRPWRFTYYYIYLINEIKYKFLSSS